MTAVDNEVEVQAQALRDAAALREDLVAPRRGMGPIVVGMDGSESSAAALEWAARLAKAFGAEVIAVHALPFATEVVQDCPPLGLTDWRAILKRKLNGSWSDPLRRAEVPYRVRLVHRSPGAAILEVAEEAGADLVVVGSRHHRHGHLAGGSLSHHLVRRASCPVVTVPS